MATMTVSTEQAVPGGPLSARLTTTQIWGFALLAPYFLVFLAFVLYPVGYGLWLARHPSSYVTLYHDPVFARDKRTQRAECAPFTHGELEGFVEILDVDQRHGSRV